jgi:hypothetical protein
MIYPVNDGRHPDYPQPTPKARVLAYLNDVLQGKRKTTYEVMEEEWKRHKSRSVCRMTDLAQVALDFCRDILGWGDSVIASTGYIASPSSGKPSFQFASLESCHIRRPILGEHDAGWYVQITSIEEGWSVLVSGPDDDGFARGSDLCECLMRAALEVKRKIDGVKDE